MQYLIEEAVFERLEIEELRKRASDAPALSSLDPAMDQAQAFAEGRI